MGSASSTAVSGVSFGNTEGNIITNKPNYVAWIVGGLALAVVAYLLLRKRR